MDDESLLLHTVRQNSFAFKIAKFEVYLHFKAGAGWYRMHLSLPQIIANWEVANAFKKHSEYDREES